MKVMSRKNRFIRVGSRALFSEQRGTGRAVSGEKGGKKKEEKRGKRKKGGEKVVEGNGVEMEWAGGKISNACIREGAGGRRQRRPAPRALIGAPAQPARTRTTLNNVARANLHTDGRGHGCLVAER